MEEIIRKAREHLESKGYPGVHQLNNSAVLSKYIDSFVEVVIEEHNGNVVEAEEYLVQIGVSSKRQLKDLIEKELIENEDKMSELSREHSELLTKLSEITIED